MLQGAAGDLILFDSSLYHAGCPAEDPTGTTGGQRLPLGSVMSFSPYIPRLRRTPDCNSQWGSELQGQWSDAGFVLTLLPMSRHGPEALDEHSRPSGHARDRAEQQRERASAPFSPPPK